LLDKITVTKPDLSEQVRVSLEAPERADRGRPLPITFRFKNRSRYALVGTQVVIGLPEGVVFESASTGTATVVGRDVIVSLGRTVPQQDITVHITAHISDAVKGPWLTVEGAVRSSTALPVVARPELTKIGR
jgi:hypothetical protein